MYLLQMPLKLRFVCLLDDLLTEKGWSYTDLHKISGISKTTIRNLTRGGYLERIDRSSTEKIMNALGCKFEDLWEIKFDD
jgi:DNA-binding Xre family transcriptional regulator